MFHFFYQFKKHNYFKSINSLSATSKVLLILFLGLFTLHTSAMMFFEGWSLEIALWFTVTAGTTVGFGDYAPATTMGRLATVFLIYVPAIPTIAFLTGRLVDKIVARRERIIKGNWNWNMSNHIVFINYPNVGGDLFFHRIIKELKESFSDISQQKIIIVTDKRPDGLPQKLNDLGVKLVTGRPNSEESLKNASIGKASKVIILCEDTIDSRSDSLVFDIASLIMEIRKDNPVDIVAESILETTKGRLKRLGVKNVLRPIRAYPEFVARAIISPGSEQIIESIFDSSSEECLKFKCDFKGTWAELAIKILQSDYGTPIAIETKSGEVRANLRSGENIEVNSIFVIVAESNKHILVAGQDIFA